MIRTTDFDDIVPSIAFLGNIAVKLIGLFLKMFDDLRIESRRKMLMALEICLYYVWLVNEKV